MVGADDVTVGEHCGSIGDPPLDRIVVENALIEWVDEPDDYGTSTRRCGKTVEHAKVLCNESFSQHQVLRRISNDRQLG